MPRGQGDSESRVKALRARLGSLDDYFHALSHAEAVRRDNAPELPSLSGALEELARRQQSVQSQLNALGMSRIESRLRPKQQYKRWAPERPRAHVYIDETGLQHGFDSTFDVFGVAAVIIAETDIQFVESSITEWQNRWNDGKYAHELDVRNGRERFHPANCARDEMLASWVVLVASLPLTIIAVVIDKALFRLTHPDGRVDDHLPTNVYALAVNILFERVVHCLYGMEDSIGMVIAEGVGEKEDAELQRAFSYLKLRGTRFVSERWFRYQTREHIEFFGKAHNIAGLQIADWVVKPCADAAIHSSRPETKLYDLEQCHVLWRAVRPLLYDGKQVRPDHFGLKIYPRSGDTQRALIFPGVDLSNDWDWSPEKLKGSLAQSAGSP